MTNSNRMVTTSQDIRLAIEHKWKNYLSEYANLFSSDYVNGSSPPSVFVGSYNYPNVYAGPMVPPVHGNTTIFDMPEKWLGKSLEQLVNFRLQLIRGVKKTKVNEARGRYIEDLQEAAMASRPIDSDIFFHKKTLPTTTLDGENAPFGPIGEIKSANFSNLRSDVKIENAYYDYDLSAKEAVTKLYSEGVEISKIQRCLSIGMFGKTRRLVPTRWSITATDDIISKDMVNKLLDFPVIDAFKLFTFEHLGNTFCIILFPHRWIFEMQEAWFSQGTLGFGSDFEDARGIDHPPSIAGAYFAGKLAVTEYLNKEKSQSGVLILREIRPEYAVPVGVWQVREGIREAMRQKPLILDSLDSSIDEACKKFSVSKQEWLSHGNLLRMLRQKTITDFF